MCQLLGLNSNEPADISFSFSGLMQRGGNTDCHKDGWGLAFFEGKSCRLFREACPSCNSKLAEFIKAYPLKSKIIIGHIRKANSGKVSLENTHPFQRELWGQTWVFAHNGQVKSAKKLPLKRFHPIGTTDSEYAFCWLLDQIAKRFPSPPKNKKEFTDCWEFIYKCCLKLNEHGRFNILLSDSIHLFAFCNTNLHWITRKPPFGHAQLKDADIKINFNEKNSLSDIISIIATEPLTTNENWQKMSKKEFHVFKNGVSIRSYNT